jgi:drug/metabolite transporter (DMT)-like permease
MPSSREPLGLLLGLIGVAIFAGTLPATRIAVSAIDPLALTASRTAIAGLCSLALLIVLRRPLPPRHLWLQLVVTMICVGMSFPFLMAVAMQSVDASHGGVVLGILPIATAFVAVLITHERPKPLFWIASIIGAALVITFALRQGGGLLSVGDVLLFAAIAAAAIGYALSIPATILTMPADVASIPLKPWLALLYVALFSQWIGFFAWNAGMAMGGIARVSQTQLLQPFVTFVLAASFNGEEITPQILFFAAAVVATVAISSRVRVRR